MLNWFKKGEHWVWFGASAVSVSVVLVFGLIIMIAFKGLSHFWPHEIYDLKVNNNGAVEQVVGEIHQVKTKKEITFLAEEGVELVKEVPQYLMKVGNRDIYGVDFRWISSDDLVDKNLVTAPNVVVIERYEWGNVYGQFDSIVIDGQVKPINEDSIHLIDEMLAKGEAINSKIHHIEKTLMGRINYQIEILRLEQKKLESLDKYDAATKASFEQKRSELEQAFLDYQADLRELYKQSDSLGEIVLTVAGGQKIRVQVKNIVKLWQPNEMGFFEDISFFVSSIGSFLWDDPREANTEGGVFPAIIGTITMVILMAVFVMPMGVIAAIYMSEYAREGALLRIVRISINNLAGVPSIVFGIFGLGFFVYIIGGNIDEMFYSYALPSPTFGTPGLLWASLTMALLTLPVVIVSTQEGLSRVPMNLREGALALGATKSESIMKVVLPMSLPAIMTGLILAVARAAGEVAPLMLVGVVKLAPELPIDFNAPFIHLERKFMHLGFHIYDVGFQSPNVEASQPLVYATSLLLVVIIVSLNLGAISIRNRLRERYKSLSH
ncbi:MAG TPA: phosphate ABC transporter permease PtsA [Thiomicrospira sp.]|nr:phosphate ABC transporter permease PtsA [Thiomicrospira sp.]